MEQITAQFDCIIAEIKHKDGDIVQTGEEILVVESLKMQFPVTCQTSGIIKYNVKQNDYVYLGSVMATISA